MRKNIFDKPKRIHELFRDEQFLYPDFVPERLPHRDEAIDSMVYAFQPVLKGGKPINLAVFGPTGVGKTCVVKFVLKELQEFSKRAKPLYINCFEYNTRHSILTRITNFLGRVVPRRGIATDEAYSLMAEALEKSDFVPLIVLDEVDQLIYREDGSKLFYDLLRVNEHGKGRLGLVVISNDLNMSVHLDARVKSSFMEEKIVFNPYTPLELKDILRDRTDNAFLPDVLDADVVNVAAGHAAKRGGDARIAIESVLFAGRIAEKENSDKVLVDHLRKAFEEIEATPAKKILKHLSDAEKKMLLLMADFNKEISSGDLYVKFNAKGEKLTDRRLREFVSRLSTVNLISTRFVEKKGKTRMISLKVSPDLIRTELK